MVELQLLRRVEIFSPGREIGAGIDHVAVEPEPVEIVRHVEVIADAFGVLRAARAFEATQPERRPPL